MIGRCLLLVIAAALAAPAPGAAAPTGTQTDGSVTRREDAERKLARLTRAALREPVAPGTWAAITGELEAFRPEAFRDMPSGAERAALALLDSIVARTPGAVHELRVEPAGPHTEIVVEAAGDVRYRLFRQLSDPVDPRLILVLYGASIALPETEFDDIDRGGVRGVRIDHAGADTVHVSISLAGTPSFMLVRREGEVVVRIDNHMGEFAAWSSRPAWSRARARIAPVAAAMGSPVGALAAAATASVGGDSLVAAAAPVAPVPAPAGRDAVSTAASVAWDAGSTTVSPAWDAVRVRAGRIANAVIDRVRPFAETVPWRIVAIACLTALLLAIAVNRLRPTPDATVAPGRTPYRWRTGKRSPSDAAARGRAPAPRAGTRVWAARTLAASGASMAEIARRTGLAQDALRLLSPNRRAAADPAESAASGMNYRSPAGAAAAARAAYGSANNWK